MENNNKPGKSFRPIVAVFIVVVLLAVIGRNWLLSAVAVTPMNAFQ